MLKRGTFWMTAALGVAFFGLARQAHSAGPIVQDWAVHYNSAAGFDDAVAAVAVDSDGNVVVTGYSANDFSGTNCDWVTVKYHGSTGATLWEARYNNAARNLDDRPAALALDASGNVFVTGYSTRNNFDYLTLKYDGATGTQQWATPYNGPGNFTDRATAIGVDSSGNVFVTGRSFGATNGDDYATLKYDGATGSQTWVARYTGPSIQDDGATDLVVDPSDNVLVTGFSRGSGTSDDYATVKYNGSTGTQSWASRYNGPPANQNDQARSIAVDASGNAFVTGVSAGTGTGNDYATLKYDASTGSQLWVSRYNGPPGSQNDSGQAVAVDTSGNLFVTGSSVATDSAVDYATLKYDGGTGAPLWSGAGIVSGAARYTSPGSAIDSATALALTASGDVVVTGTASFGSDDLATVQYNGSTGGLTWDITHDGGGDTAAAVAVDDEETVFVAGRSTQGGSFGNYVTLKYRAPSPASNLTPSFLITRSGLKKHLGTGRWVQTVTVKNTSGFTLAGPFSVALDGLTAGAALYNKTGNTVYTSPTGSPYRNHPAAGLAPGASLAVTLEFTQPGAALITYTPRVLAGPGDR